jgi:predicted transposase/invertase (TIGR01784 family)
MRYLDPKNDLTFKKVFGEHPHLLRSFLNALLPLAEGQQIEHIEYIPAELVPNIPLLKNSIVDVRCTDNRGRQFIVEMQMLWTDSFKNRVLFNASKAYVKQLDRGHEYKGLKPVYALSLVNEDFEPDTRQYYHHYAIVHTEYPEKRIDGLQFVFVELPKFKAQNLTEKKLQILWLRYLTEIEDGTERLPADLLEIPEVREAIEHLQESAFTREELATYDKYWDSISSERTLIEDAYSEGEEKGEEKKALSIARSMKAKGFDTPTIAELTGLSPELIERL